MDWIRRNWPDLLIGVALVAVIAGIIITLLSGGSFSMFDRSRRTVTTPNQTTTTNSPFSSPDATTPDTTTPDTTTPITTLDQTPAPDPANANTGASIEPILPDLPVADASQDADTAASAANTANNATTATANAANNATTASNTTAPNTTASNTTAAETTTTANAASTPIPPAAAGAAPYRVSVGAFGQRQNAEVLASTFRERGYPVFVAQEGDLFITLVGPYEQEAAANQVANRIRAEGNDALVYRLSTPEPAPAQAAPAQAAPAQAAPQASQASPDWTNRGGTYLQVGAYASLESSLPQRRRLESLGFNVSERFSDDLVRLVIGPFTEAEVPVAQAQLNANGIDNFPVQ